MAEPSLDVRMTDQKEAMRGTTAEELGHATNRLRGETRGK